jgi:uncharacterized membrane protein
MLAYCISHVERKRHIRLGNRFDAVSSSSAAAALPALLRGWRDGIPLAQLIRL